MENTKRGLKHLDGVMDRGKEGISDKRKAWQKPIEFSQGIGFVFFVLVVAFISLLQMEGRYIVTA